jgi:hypothetical protein
VAETECRIVGRETDIADRLLPRHNCPRKGKQRGPFAD